jgi:hypothetical protein
MNTDQDNGPTSLAPLSPVQTCSSTTKAGGACHNRPVPGLSVCVMHSERRTELASQGSAASAKARKARVTKRQEADERAKLTVTQGLRAHVAERRQELIEATWDAAVVKKDIAALRLLWDRVEGPMGQHLAVTTNDADDPESMTDAQLKAWIVKGMPPEEAARFLDETARLEEQFNQE